MTKALCTLACLFSIASPTFGGTWTPLVRTAPNTIGLMILLSDGTVLCQNNSGNAWYRLTPDSQGHYVNGTWTTLQAMHDTRQYCASQVLSDGRFFIAGGEYGTGGRTGETYDPLTNTWTITPLPGRTISDANSGILPDGRVMVAVVDSSVSPFLRTTLLFNPVTNAWATGPTTVGIHNESVWVKLPDDSILFVDRNTTSSERYIPASNQWISDATVPVSLYDPYGLEAGAALMLPNGKVFFIGSLGHTAIYTPSGTTANGSWVAGPDLPNATGQPDGPAVMLPNGKILCAVSPVPTSSNHFPSPTTFYEYDYTTNSFASVATPTGATLNHPCYWGTMLVVPDGTALYVDFNSRIYSYQPDGSPVASGKPLITSITQNADGSFHLTGTGLNGISEGSSYGDDNQNSSNYPIVRLTGGDGTVYQARTYNWSRNGVMTGAAAVTTEFMLPTGLSAGTYSVTAVTNGISSDPTSVSFSPIVITLPASATEGAAPVNGTVTLPSAPASNLTVNLSSSLSSRASTPASVTVLAGQTSATFSLTIGNDALLNGSQAVAVSASASGYQAGVRNIVINDDETANLSITPSTSLSSSGVVGGPFSPSNFTYTLTNTGTVSLNWAASKSGTWNTFTSSSGAIVAGGTATVTVNINAGLTANTYTDTILFNNTTNGAGNTSRSITLVVNSPPTMGVSPSGGLTSTGVYGGPFTPLNSTYTLSNPGTVSLNWSASKTANWVNLSATSGTITAGGTATVAVSYSSSAATLVPGSYSDTVTFTNTSSGNGNTTRAVSLTVTGSPSMSVTPAGALSASGNYGGPFTPGSADFTIKNTGNAPLNWTVAKTQSWVTLSSASGTLTPGNSATVTVSINTGANALNAASYSDTITFTNSNNGTGNTTRTLNLSVTLPAPSIVAEPAITGGTSNTVSWGSVNSADLYDVQKASDSSFSSPLTNSTSSTSASFSSLGDGVTYCYRARANRSTGYTGPWSATVSSKQDATNPALTISGPTTTLKSSIQLQGTSSDSSGLAAVQAGGIAVQTSDNFAHWTATITNLANGTNSIAVTASDGATPANVTTSNWSVTRLADADADGLPDAWESAHNLTGTDRGALADPDNDGIPNLLEYAFNLDPKKADNSGLPSAATALKPADGKSYLTFTYVRRIDGGGLQYVVETSTNISGWDTTGSSVEQVGTPSANPGGITETVTVRILPSLDQGTAKFVHLRVVVQ